MVSQSSDREIPSEDKFRKGIETFHEKEDRQAIYRAASTGIDRVWGHPPEMAEQILALLTSWNTRHQNTAGRPNREKVVKAIDDLLPALSNFRFRHLRSMQKEDEEDIERVFTTLLEATQGTNVYENEDGPRTSPVGVAKTLNLMAPAFFPIWDKAIAEDGYGYYPTRKKSPTYRKEQYQQYCWDIREEVLAIETQDYNVLEEYPQSSTVKLLDEYNYAKYTKEGDWVL